MSSTDNNDEAVTAQDYIQSQIDSEQEARRIMPYNFDECTYTQGELRQPVFACLSCSRANKNIPVGVCYSCSIQCHSAHDIVELFSKRNFVCDCGTSRMAGVPNGACKLRVRNRNEPEPSLRPRTGSDSGLVRGLRSELELGAEDIASSSNNYNQNFEGRFCSCKELYNPLEETRNMIQCYFGFSCGEDWFHEDCIMGYRKGLFKNGANGGGENLLDSLTPPGEDAVSDLSSGNKVKTETKQEIDSEDDENDSDKVPHFPELDDFDSFICWKCVADFKDVFGEIENDTEVVYKKLPHFEDVASADDWYSKNNDFVSGNSKPESNDDEARVKRVKLENPTPYSILLANNFRDKLLRLEKEIPKSSKLGQFLTNHPYIFKDDPVYEPPEDDDDTSTTNSLLDLGVDALSSLPREQAIEGLQAYDKIRSKLKDFFKPFAEQGKIVTEKEVRDFFGSIKKEP